MFDKVENTVVEAVYVTEGKAPKPKPNPIAVYVLPTVALFISLSSFAVSYLSYGANQEGMNIIVKRDNAAAIEIAIPEGEVMVGRARVDAAYVTQWDVSIVNTSLTAIIPVTGFEIVNQSFTGTGTITGSDKMLGHRGFGFCAL